MKLTILGAHTISNVSRTLAVNVNLLISLLNKNYTSEILTVDGNPKPGLREDPNGNIFLKYRFKELKPGEEIETIYTAKIKTKIIDRQEKLFLEIGKIKSRIRPLLVYPEGLRRIRKISERLLYKSRLLIDFERNIIEFLEKNFKVNPERGFTDLDKILNTSEATVEGIINFVIALHKNAGITARKVQGFLINNSNLKEHFWFEVKIGKNWVPIDPINNLLGVTTDAYLAKKVDYTEKRVNDVNITYKTSKNWMKKVINVVEEFKKIEVEKV